MAATPSSFENLAETTVLEFTANPNNPLANNRHHYICVKCDNAFWPILDPGLYITQYNIMFPVLLLLLRAFGRINAGSSKSRAIYRIGRSYMIHVRCFGIPNTYWPWAVEISFFSNWHSPASRTPCAVYNSQYLWQPLTVRRIPRGRRC